MVKKGKPAPDLFLHAAATMDHDPERCAVIEDSPAGALAGRAAGMRVFGYAGDPETDRDALADAGATIFTDMRHLPGLLGFTDRSIAGFIACAATPLRVSLVKPEDDELPFSIAPNPHHLGALHRYRATEPLRGPMRRRSRAA